MTDFRGTLIEVGDTIAYCGRQDLKASLNEATVVNVLAGGLEVRPTGRTSSPLGRASTRLVRLHVIRKVVVVRKARADSVGLPSRYLGAFDVAGYAGPRED